MLSVHALQDSFMSAARALLACALQESFTSAASDQDAASDSAASGVRVGSTDFGKEPTGGASQAGRASMAPAQVSAHVALQSFSFRPSVLFITPVRHYWGLQPACNWSSLTKCLLEHGAAG